MSQHYAHCVISRYTRYMPLAERSFVHFTTAEFGYVYCHHCSMYTSLYMYNGSTPHHHTSCVHGSGRWLNTSPSHRLCICVRKMDAHLTIMQAVYMHQKDGSTPHHHTGCVHASEMVPHLTITQAVYMGRGDGCTPHHHTGCVHASEMVPHLTITQAGRWLNTSPSHRLCTCIREMVPHLTITQAVYMRQRWFHISPSHRLCTWVSEMDAHLTITQAITQAVYMHQGDGCTSHHHTGCVHGSERWMHTSPSHRLCECVRDLNTHQHGTRPELQCNGPTGEEKGVPV